MFPGFHIQGDAYATVNIPRGSASSSIISVVPVIVRGFEAGFPSSAPRLGGALPQLYRTILVVAGGGFFFLCLAVRFMAFDDDRGRCGGGAMCTGSATEPSEAVNTTFREPEMRSSNETLASPKIPGKLHAEDTGGTATNGDGQPTQDVRCVRPRLRACSRHDMVFTAHYLARRRGGVCVKVALKTSSCLQGPNRFRTIRECEAACIHFPLSSKAPRKAATPATFPRTRQKQRCTTTPSFGPCSRGALRSPGFAFERGRCVALRGSCTDVGFPTLRGCRAACLGHGSSKSAMNVTVPMDTTTT
ncbi:uncharacterized protein LOC144148524 [Haemaphysalis longicornis]